MIVYTKYYVILRVLSPQNQINVQMQLHMQMQCLCTEKQATNVHVQPGVGPFYCVAYYIDICHLFNLARQQIMWYLFLLKYLIVFVIFLFCFILCFVLINIMLNFMFYSLP